MYFAARGIGTSSSWEPNQTHPPSLTSSTDAYRSPARVLLSGLGADELLGGYSRHRAAFSSTPGSPNWIALIDELQLDLDRISTRNLGRDDRIIAHHAREVRYPFLDSKVVESLARLAVHLKCDPELGRGIGDKLVLRCLAHSLGLHHASRLEKRAIQFGARSAKLENIAKGTVELVEEARLNSDSTESLDRFKLIQTVRPRLTRRQVEKLVSRLHRTSEDERTGTVPSDLVLSTLTVTSSPVQEIAILAYPAHLETARRLCSAAQPIPNPPTPLYRITSIPLKGLGILANRTIKVGEVIIAERPIMIMPERLECLHQRTLDQVHFVVFDEMRYASQLALSSLSSTDTDTHPMVSKIWNNEICLELDSHSDSTSSSSTYAYSAVYPMIARCNHACACNARWHFDASLFALKLCAVRDIEVGEQITVSYIHHLIPRLDRRKKLKEKWGFECDCKACSWHSVEDQAASDRRRNLLSVEEAFFNQFLSLIPSFSQDDEDRRQFDRLLQATGSEAHDLIRRAQRALDWLGEEDLTEERATFLAAMAVICYHGTTDRTRAGEIARDCIDVVRAVKGFDSADTKELERYME